MTGLKGKIAECGIDRVKNNAIMNQIFFRICASLIRLPRSKKRLIVIAVDAVLCVVATCVAFYLRFEQTFFIENSQWQVALLSAIILVPIFLAFGLYQTVFRFSGLRTVEVVGRAIALYTLIYLFFLISVRFDGVPHTIGLIQPLILFFLIIGSRVVANSWFGCGSRNYQHKRDLPRVVIYGAGSAGRQLARALVNESGLHVVGFIDDDERLHGCILLGFPVFSSRDLPSLVTSKGVDHTLLAMPSISRAQRNAILNYVSKYPVVVRTIPSMVDLIHGRVSIDNVKEPDLDDLLGRDAVAPDKLLLEAKITGKAVMITGAGGSIGSELSRQVSALGPSVLLLVEASEFALYEIHSELTTLQDNCVIEPKIKLIPLLGSVQDWDQVWNIISTWRPDTIYHAAAYKHVPLVEHNLIEGIKNNVFGTLTVVEAAIKAGVSDLVLISTDKAVRPANVMGATKRLAEMILQSRQSERDSKTRFSMVRFGNVLASSGSVIPRFRSQIRNGGPITVTHMEVERFFMTIPEAAQLVIQASALADRGEVFILDMGEPVKIVDLAERMVKLSGLTVKTPDDPEGDIAIEITGLRPGEKLYEELLIGRDPQPTSHPRIMRAKEDFIPWNELHCQLMAIKSMAANNDIEGLITALQDTVIGFKPSSDVVDWIHLEKKKNLFKAQQDHSA